MPRDHVVNIMKEGTKKNFGIVLIDRGKLEYYDVLSKKVYVFNFSTNLVNDLEIIDRKGLETQMFLFINYYKIHPVPLIIVLSVEVCFELPIVETDEAKFENIVNKFLFTLPFEESLHKIYRQTKDHLLIAVNRELIDTFKYIYTKMGFMVEAVVSSSIIGIDVKTIDNATAEFILAKANQIKEQSLITVEIETGGKKTEEKKVMGVRRVFLLLAFFLMLLSILLFLLYQQTLGVKNSKSDLTTFYVHSSVKMRG